MDSKEKDISISNIRAAAERIRGQVHPTPINSSTQLSKDFGVDLHFKCENFQKTGSFKVRGVLNKLQSLSAEERKNGLISVSAGNHAQAMAWAAAASGIECTVVMPDTASRTKIKATEEYGAAVLLPGGVHTAFAKMLELESEEGKTVIHPFEDPLILAGHGTVGLEVLEQLDSIDAIVVGVGGGALSAGIAIAAKEQNPNIKIYGAEPAGANAMQQSLAAGRPLRLEKVGSIADGLAPPMAGEIPFSILNKYMDDLVTVTEDEIRKAMYQLLTRTKLLVEPAGAAATAAVFAKRLPIRKGERVVSILSGGNVDLEKLPEFVLN